MVERVERLCFEFVARTPATHRCEEGEEMNTQKLYSLVRVYEEFGMNHEAAFERAFHEYKELMQRLKVRTV